MATIAELAVNVVARTTAFTKGIGNVRRGLSSLNRSLSSSTAKIASFAAGVISAGAVLQGLRRQFEDIDRISKLADRTGFATESLAALERGATLSGISIETLSNSLSDMQKRLGEVALFGSGEAKMALDQLGISAERLISLTPIERLKLLADSINAFGDASQRGALAAKLFGRAGSKDFLTFLAQGSSGIDQLLMDAEKLGITFDRLSGSQVEQANDAFADLKLTIDGVFRSIAIDLAPSLKDLSANLTEATTGANSFGARLDAANVTQLRLREGFLILRNAATGFNLQGMAAYRRQLTDIRRERESAELRAQNRMFERLKGGLVFPTKPEERAGLRGQPALDQAAAINARGLAALGPAPNIGPFVTNLLNGLPNRIAEGTLKGIGGLSRGLDIGGTLLDRLTGQQRFERPQPLLAGAALAGSAEAASALARAQVGAKDEQQRQTQLLTQVAEYLRRIVERIDQQPQAIEIAAF